MREKLGRRKKKAAKEGKKDAKKRMANAPLTIAEKRNFPSISETFAEEIRENLKAEIGGVPGICVDGVCLS